MTPTINLKITENNNSTPVQSDLVSFEEEIKRLIVEQNIEKIRLMFLYAVSENNAEKIKIVLEYSINKKEPLLQNIVNTKLTLKFTPLMQACQTGKLETVKILVEAGASLSDCDFSGRNSLWHACDYGRVRVVKYLLSVLMEDQLQNKSECLSILESQDKFLGTPMMAAAACPNLSEGLTIVKHFYDFLKRTLGRRYKNYYLKIKHLEHGHSIMYNAACANNIELMQFLSTKGLSLWEVGVKGRNIIGYALFNGCVPLFSYLLSMGCNISQIVIDPLNGKAFTLLGYIDMLEHMESSEEDFVDYQPLKRVILAAQKLMVLAERGTLVNSEDSDTKAKDETVETLLAAGASVHQTDAEGRTPLHIAILHGQFEVAELLIANKAHVEVRDHVGRTPLDYTNDYARTNANAFPYLCLLVKMLVLRISLYPEWTFEKTQEKLEAIFKLIHDHRNKVQQAKLYFLLGEAIMEHLYPKRLSTPGSFEVKDLGYIAYRAFSKVRADGDHDLYQEAQSWIAHMQLQRILVKDDLGNVVANRTKTLDDKPFSSEELQSSYLEFYKNGDHRESIQFRKNILLEVTEEQGIAGDDKCFVVYDFNKPENQLELASVHQLWVKRCQEAELVLSAYEKKLSDEKEKIAVEKVKRDTMMHAFQLFDKSKASKGKRGTPTKTFDVWEPEASQPTFERSKKQKREKT